MPWYRFRRAIVLPGAWQKSFCCFSLKRRVLCTIRISSQSEKYVLRIIIKTLGRGFKLIILQGLQQIKMKCAAVFNQNMWNILYVKKTLFILLPLSVVTTSIFFSYYHLFNTVVIQARENQEF